MRPLVHALLALLLAVSAASHGALRMAGTTAGQLVLCTPEGAVAVTLGPDGTPRSGPAHHCPDCLPLPALAVGAYSLPAASLRVAFRITPAVGAAVAALPVPRHPPARAPPPPPVA